MILIYGGTSDSVDILKEVHHLGAFGYCATTQAGIDLVRSFTQVKTFLGKQSAEDMRDLWQSEAVTLIIDATHPFAQAVTSEILDVATALDLPLIRYRRPIVEIPKSTVFYSHEAVIDYLKAKSGNVLLTTGSNHAKMYVDALGAKRVIARVLPVVESIKKLDEAGVIPMYRIGQYGPFSQFENEMHLEFAGAKSMVSKNSGKKGMVAEKQLACEKMGAELLLIEPPVEDGDHVCHTIDEVKSDIEKYI